MNRFWRVFYIFMETNRSMLKKSMIGLAVSMILIVFDQITKILAINGLKNKNPFVILENVFELHYLENRGAAFGILQGRKGFFIIFTIFVLILIVYIFLKRIPNEKKFIWMDSICILFFSGAVGNFIDRLCRNYVVDFFYFKLIDFPIFNVADIYVTVAAAAMIILGIFYYNEDDYNKIFPTKEQKRN